MAAKRISRSAIDWAKIAERVPEAQKPRFHQFKTKSESYLRRMMANPETAPKIDWAYYKAKVPVPGMVDTFQKTYESMQIPYPQDSVTPLIDTQAKEVKQEIAAFKEASNKRISGYKSEISHINSLLPYEQMTMEDFAMAHPDLAHDPLNKPTFWPHTPEEQLDYKGDQDKVSAH